MKAMFLAGCARWLWMDKIENLGWDRQVSSLHQGSVPGGRPQGKTPKVSPLFFTLILWKKELIWLNRALFQMKICQSISLSPLMTKWNLRRWLKGRSLQKRVLVAADPGVSSIFQVGIHLELVLILFRKGAPFGNGEKLWIWGADSTVHTNYTSRE